MVGMVIGLGLGLVRMVGILLPDGDSVRLGLGLYWDS